MSAKGTSIFALVDDVDVAARVVEELQQAGVADDQMEIMSGVPLDHAVLGRPKVPERMTVITPTGAVIGFITGILFTFGTIMLYSIRVGGHSFFAIPPKLVIIYEFTMLGIILSTFFAGTFWQSGLLPFRRKVYDPSISDGRIGLLITVPEGLRARVLEILNRWGAEIKDEEWRPL